MTEPHATIVDGRRLPKPVGGHPAVDFCNTYAGWGDAVADDRGEWLRTYDDLAVWTRQVGLVTPRQVARLRAMAAESKDPGAVEEVLRNARDLRADLYRVLTRPPANAAFGRIAAVAERANASTSLAARRNAPAEWRLRMRDDLELPLLAAGLAAARLLCSSQTARLRVCPGRACGWLFIDASGRRRWCRMDTCGNRAKVRAFAERHR